ncbi:TetR/AcrR family transcriptional regulator [Actinomycetospora sp. OC33-EN08]|uniref:TetR/AcrR family transcriptional regulator n=1 Tax=Actinomycetospora aurantiaca TaxID=3129233 RepID=A0ABU8MKX0_9PSEU
MPTSVWLRPERAAVGRPARRSRSEITAAAVAVADRDGAEAVSMRRVAAELGTGAGTLYRYVETRDELLDLMADHVTGEYAFAAPTGDWLEDLVATALQARDIHRRHPWLADRVLTAPGTGPHGADLVEHHLAVLAEHPADDGAKLVALGVLSALVATFARAEHAGRDLERNAEYMAHVAAAGTHPHISALDAPPPDPAHDPLPDVLRRVLTGLLPIDSGS